MQIQRIQNFGKNNYSTNFKAKLVMDKNAMGFLEAATDYLSFERINLKNSEFYKSLKKFRDIKLEDPVYIWTSKDDCRIDGSFMRFIIPTMQKVVKTGQYGRSAHLPNYISDFMRLVDVLEKNIDEYKKPTVESKIYKEIEALLSK